LAKVWKILIGPASFFLSAFLLWGTFTPAASFAIATAVWMALWWIIRPVSIYVTAFVPIVVNAFFNLIPNSHVISQYFSEIAVLLLGSDLICLTWTTTGLDKRVSVKALCFIGTSMKNQIFVWFLASTVLSIFLPNVVVAAIFCPIAVAMLRSVGEDDVTESRMALPILLAIGWGSGIGGFGSPIGSSANLVAVSYIEKLTGHEFMYYDWVIRFLPLLAIVFLLNLIFLWLIPAPAKDLPGTRAYFREMYSKFGTMRRGEKIGLYLFILATALAFIRPLFASFLPAMKPAYVFLVIGMLMFFLHDENGKTMLDWQYAESHAM
jgi:sodium-dependent dicarboxylate transporter 2/3/5